jgi:phosphoribosylformylglycinamidine synthase
MVVAVPPEHAEQFHARCDRHRVDYADIGEFTGDGRLVVRSGGNPVLDLDTTFLHDGRPTRSMNAVVPVPAPEWTSRNVHDPGVTLLELLAHPNIASKAAIVHRYDHEIGGATLVRPLTGPADVGHADGVVMARPEDEYGFAVGIGVNPWYGLHDPKAMAEVAIDEAIRNVVAVGADPDLVALLDNFSWGDPRDAATLGELAAAVEGCCAAATTFGAPFVSGKDSLNNTYAGRDGKRHAVPPTLVVTAVAHVPDVEACITPELRRGGNVLLILGETGTHFAGSHLDLLAGAHRTASPEAGRAPQFDPGSPARYRGLHQAIRRGLVQSCHDVSEGGLAVAVAEMCIASGLGATIDSLPHEDVTAALFSESAGRLVVEVADSDADAVIGLVGGGRRIGVVTEEPLLDISGAATIEVGRLRAAFHGEDW